MVLMMIVIIIYLEYFCEAISEISILSKPCHSKMSASREHDEQQAKQVLSRLLLLPLVEVAAGEEERGQ